VFAKDYFALFDLPVKFALDVNTLRDKYRALQAKVHPDKFANASAQEKRLSVQYASYVNQAFQTLRDPMERGRYLLELKGEAWGDESATIKDPSFLIEQMELRETLAEMPAAHLPEFLRNIAERMSAIESELGNLLDVQGSLDLASARVLVQKLQFLKRLQHEVNEKSE
jgi:molecular chaperone HscB